MIESSAEVRITQPTNKTTPYYQKADDLALATDGNPLRLLPGMAIRIKDDADSDCAGCEGRNCSTERSERAFGIGSIYRLPVPEPSLPSSILLHLI